MLAISYAKVQNIGAAVDGRCETTNCHGTAHHSLGPRLLLSTLTLLCKTWTHLLGHALLPGGLPSSSGGVGAAVAIRVLKNFG